MCFVHSYARILWSLTHIKLLPASSLFCTTGGTERQKKIVCGGGWSTRATKLISLNYMPSLSLQFPC